MADDFSSFTRTPNSFGFKSRLVTPGATDLDPRPKAVVCVTYGDITVVPENNANAAPVAFVGVPAGFVPPFRVRRVTAATAVVYTVED